MNFRNAAFVQSPSLGAFPVCQCSNVYKAPTFISCPFKSSLLHPYFSSSWARPTPNTVLISKLRTSRSMSSQPSLSMLITTPTSWGGRCSYFDIVAQVHIYWLTQRRLIDWRMLPLLGLLYSVALIDRTNLGIARIAGMELDLVSCLCSASYIDVHSRFRNYIWVNVTVLHRWSTSFHIFYCKPQTIVCLLSILTRIALLIDKFRATSFCNGWALVLGSLFASLVGVLPNLVWVSFQHGDGSSSAVFGLAFSRFADLINSTMYASSNQYS